MNVVMNNLQFMGIELNGVLSIMCILFLVQQVREFESGR